MDFAIGLLLFTFTLIVYFSYTNNFQKQDKGDLETMLTDARTISSSLALSGYPANWSNSFVIRIGLADEQVVNGIKIKSFKQLNYSFTKSIFPTIFDYIVFFTDSNGNVLNINGVCGIGSPSINLTYKVRTAYYYQDPADSFLKNFMNQTFNADIYFDDQSNDINGLYGFVKNLSKYGFIVMEHPFMQPPDFNDYKDQLENYSSEGGLFMISGELVSAQNKDFIGATFKKKSGQSISDRNSTVNNTDQYLSLSVGQNIVFRQAYYVENLSTSANFKIIATFNLDHSNSVAKWKYGNGTVYFFSDFDVSNFNGNFVGIVEDATQGFIQGTCTNVSIAGLKLNKLVKAERYLNYNSKVVKMNVYVWQ